MRSATLTLLLLSACTAPKVTQYDDPIEEVEAGAPAAHSRKDAGAPSEAGPQADGGAPVADAGAPDAGRSLAAQMTPRVQSLGGPVLASPRFIVVSWLSDPFEPAIDTLADQIAASQYWHDAVSEYGVGAVTSVTRVHVNGAAPAQTSDAEIQTWLGNLVSNGQVPLDANAVYAVFYPSGTQVTNPDLGPSCDGFVGYHAEIAVRAQKLAYAVIPRCANERGNGGFDEVSFAASHELVEAVTDPFFFTAPAYKNVGDADYAWTYALSGSELADMCNDGRPNATVSVAGIQGKVQRTWSNAAAAAGHDPCVPSAGAYFDALPEHLEDVDVTAYGAKHHTRGVRAAPGASVTLDLAVYGDGTGDPIDLSAIDVDQSEYGAAQRLAFRFDRATANPGDRVKLTIDVLSAGSSDFASFSIVTKSQNRMNVWIGLVGLD